MSCDVSLPELKMSTNLKMHLKPSVQNVWQNGKSGSTLYLIHLVGKAVPKLNFSSLGGWLRAILGGAAFGSSRGPATRCKSKSLQDSKMVRYSNGKYLKFRSG